MYALERGIDSEVIKCICLKCDYEALYEGMKEHWLFYHKEPDVTKWVYASYPSDTTVEVTTNGNTVMYYCSCFSYQTSSFPDFFTHCEVAHGMTYDEIFALIDLGAIGDIRRPRNFKEPEVAFVTVQEEWFRK